MQALERNLQNLQTVLTEEGAASVLNPVSIISDINDFCARIKDEEIGLCSSLLFNEEKGLFRFVDRSLILFDNNKAMTLARKAIFDFIFNYIKQIERRIADYALEIKRWCLNIFRREQSNIVKQATFPPIVKLIELDLPGLDAESLEVKQLFDIYLREFLKGKSGATVKGSILHILGVLSEHFPGEVSMKSKQLLQIYMDTLRVQSTKPEPDTQLISSCFKGLASYMNNFGESVEGTQFLKDLYMYLTKALERVDAARHDIPKAALSLLECHAYQFKEYLTVDAERMYERMKALCAHRNDKVRKYAFPALDAFLSHVSHELVKGSRNIQLNQRTFAILMEQGKSMLDAKNGNKYTLSMAIRSFGQLAAPMKMFLGETDTKFILMKLLKFSDQLLTRSQEELEESVAHLPSFISVFANIILELDTVDTWIIDHLERIIGVLYLVFPKQFLFPKYRYANYVAMMKLFISLYLKQNALDQLLSRIVFQGLALTISNSAAIGEFSETEKEQSGGALYDQYLELWHNLLNPKNIQLAKWSFPWLELDFSTDLQEHMFSIVYDKILDAITEMLNKLDLRCRVVDETVPINEAKKNESNDSHTEEDIPIDVLSNMRPVNPKDFELYLNLVEFTKKFIRKCQPRHFLRWVYIFSKLMVEKSSKHPYISGFYKKLTVAMKICEEYDYFEGISEQSQVYDPNLKLNTSPDALNTTMSDQNNIQKQLFETDIKTKISCFHLLSKFCRETIHRLHEFKGDLLAACIRFILSMPKQFVSAELFIIPLTISFEMGLSYLPLASVGLTALEYYMKVLPKDSLRQSLPRVLPFLSQYLIVRSTSEEGDDVKDLNKELKSTTKNTIKKFDVQVEKRKRKEASKLFKDVDKTSLRSIQLRIIRLLGKLGGENTLILKDKEVDSGEVISWDTKERIQFSLPFRDVKPEIFYDSILPRVVELAEKSGDRQTKIAAGEFLHSIVLYMVGRNAYSPQARQRAQQRLQEEQEAQRRREQRDNKQPTEPEAKTEVSSEPTPFYNIYSKIFPTLLRLAVDTEVVTKQLFEPLMYQLTHWLTQNMNYENKETMVLLDSIIDGLSNPKDGALRDLSANLLNEFLRWSVKHDQSNKYVNVKSLFRRLYSYSHHPNVHKRLGAILGFNRMYRSFREVDELVDRHVLDWLHNIVTSLRISSADDTGTGVTDRTKELLGHIEKIIVYKHKSLLTRKSDRGQFANLEEIVEWLFTQCSSSEILCRRQCMKLFPSLCMLLEDFNTEDGPKRWIHMMAKRKGLSFLTNKIDQDLIEVEPQIEVREDKKLTGLLSHVIFWLSNLESYLDYVLWLYENQLLLPHQLFAQRTEKQSDIASKKRKLSENDSESTSTEQQQDSHPLFRHLLRFIKDFAWKRPNQIMAVSGAEEEKLKAKKCSTIIKLMEFVALMTEKFSDTLLKQEKILSTRFFGLMFTGVLNPERLGFITTEENIQTALPRQIKRIISAVSHDKKLNEQGYAKNMINTLKKLINSEGRMNLSRFSLSDVTLNLDDATFLFRGYRLLNMLNILEGNMAISTPQISVRMGTMIFNHEQMLTPVQVHIAKELWSLCFDFGFPPKLLIQFLMDDTPWGKDDLLSQKLSQIDRSVLDRMETDESEHNKDTHAKLSKRGEVFYKNFKSEINEYISKRIEVFSSELVPRAVNNSLVFDILLSIGDLFMRNRKLEPKLFVSNVLKNISPLAQHVLTDKQRESFDFKINVLKLVQKLLILDSSLLQDSSSASETVAKLVLFALQSKRDATNPSIDLKLEGIRAIPLILEMLMGTDRTNVLQQVRSIVINEFPLSYAELQPTTAAYEDHMNLLEALLIAMQKSKSVDFMEQILPVFRWKDHPLKPKMSRHLRAFFVSQTPEGLLACTNLCLNTFFNETLPIDIRQNVIQWVCMLCAQTMNERVLTQFFELNIKKIINAIVKAVTYDPTIMNEDDIRAIYVTKTCCFNLTEAMYRLLPAIVVKDSINKVFCDKTEGLTGKELTERLMRAAYSARSYCPSDEETKAIGYPLLVEYHMAAYNSLAGAVKCTQTQEKFYTGFLFKEKNNDLWDNIIDLQKKYDFQIETNFALYSKAVQELRIDTDKNNSTSAGRGNLRMKYLSSQYLADSSLSSDIPYIGSFFVPGSRYSIAGVSDAKVDGGDASSRSNTPASEQEQKQQETTVVDVNSEETLELDEVNSNPCMPTILRIIEYLTQTFKPDKKVMPSWMSEMYNKFDDDATHPNIKLFLAKIIINKPSVFEPYASALFRPLVKLAISKDNGGTGIHYFVRDIIILLLKWKDMMPPDDVEGRGLASALIAHLMKHCANKKKVILRSNLELIKLLVEKWKTRIAIQKNIILGWICFDAKSTSAKLARTTGLQLLGVVLANDLPAYDHDRDSTVISELRFYEKILENLLFQAKEVYEAGAEVAGMLLNQLMNTNTNGERVEESIRLFDQLLLATLNTFLANKQYDRFLNCLNKIGIHSTPFLDNFLPNKVLDIMPHLYGIYKKIALQIISWRAENITDLYQSLKPFMKQFLEHQEEATQLLTLQIVFKLLRAMNREEVIHFVHIVEELHNNDEIFHSTFSETCREMYYDILIWIFDNKDGFRDVDIVRTELLKGLCDHSESVRKKILEFWDQESRLSVESLKRLEQMFTILYSQNLGENWLRNATYLLLQLMHRSPDFSDTKAIFSESLSNCEFKEYQIDLSWQSRSLPMTPLFSASANQGHVAQSYASLPQSFTGSYNPEIATNHGVYEVEPKSAASNQRPGVVRATMPAQFSLTQFGNSIREVLSDPSLSQTSLLFSPFKRLNATQTTPNATTSNNADISATPSDDNFRLRRRFTALKETQSTLNQVKRVVRLKKEKEAWEARHKMQRRNKVELYRTYRTGELPDIQIALKELILPLQALCLSDLTIAKHMFVSLFSALYPTVSTKNDIISNILKQFKSMMSHSKDCSLLISSLLSLCLKHSDLIRTTQEFITPSLIREVSLQSSNVELGVLVLERYIADKFLQEKIPTDTMSDEDDEEDQKTVEETKSKIESWIELGKLYKSLKDEDVVRSIFENNVASEQDVTQKGLDYELGGEYNEAARLYIDAIKEYNSGWKRTTSTPFKQEVEFWKERQLECFRKLTMWDKLSESVKRDVKGDNPNNTMSHIWNMRNTDLLLPLYVESQIKTSVDLDEFQQFIDDCMSIQSHRYVLESKFSPELASLSVITGQNEKAKSHVVDAYGYFVINWSSLSSLSKTGRHSLLQRLQRLVEIEEYVNFLNLPAATKQVGFVKLMNSWKNRSPSLNVDDIHVWDDVVSNRERLFDSIQKHMETFLMSKEASTSSSALDISEIINPSAPTFSSLDVIDSLDIAEQRTNAHLDRDGVAKIIAEERSRIFLLAAKAARKQLYTSAAQKYLKSSKASNTDKSEFGFLFFSSLVKLMDMKGRKHKDFVNKFDATLNFFKTYETKYDSDQSDVAIRVKYLCLLANTCTNYASVLSLRNQKSEKNGSPQQIQQRALSMYEKAVQIATDYSLHLGETRTANTFMKLGVFCDMILRNEQTISGTTSSDLACKVTSNFLSAMKYNSDAAKTRFARLLELIEKYPNTRDIFSSFINDKHLSIPDYMFIPWISQILAHLNGSEAIHLIPILDSIAEAYPQALYYPFNISREDIKNSDRNIQHRLGLLEAKLKNPMLKQLISSLRDMDHPELRWKSWTDEIRLVYKQHASDARQLQKALKDIWQQTFDDLFDADKPYCGVYNKRFAQNWAPYIKQDFGGRDASKLIQMDLKTFERKSAKKTMDMRKTKGAMLPGKSKLNYFSSWLADFYASPDTTLKSIEIPGQYGSYEKPDLDRHVKIVSFDPSILVMGSIRRPKRIKIHGNDEKDYMFLVKGGEDLRQDQRIEQMFEVMNNVLRKDPTTCKRNLYLKTYKVVPMSKDVGIIEWVDNTKPLKAIIEEELAKHMNLPQAEVLRHPTTMMHMKMLQNVTPKDVQLNQAQQYLCLFQKGKREMVEALMMEQYKHIPADLLKNGLLALSASPEAFFTLRNRYASSLAVFSICSYILGIGDRHLENFLLDCSHGQIVGIDFGHAFGSATEILPVPELMPFRLTRQLLHVMHPLSASNNLTALQQDGMVVGGGLLKENMIHTMNALHENQDILLNTMDVFIKEPLVDWLKNAARGKQQQQQEKSEDKKEQEDNNDNDDAHTWYPNRKIRLAKEKLNKMNPVHIVLDDLDANASLKPVLKYIKQVVIGDEELNVRAQMAPDQPCPTIKSQVECLIDMATDPNILGRTYIGWCAHF